MIRKVFQGCALGVLLLTAPFQSGAAVIKVCTSCELQTLEEAVARASAFDTILIAPGKYMVQNLIIARPMILVGIGYPRLVSKEGGEIITVTADSVTIYGLELDGVETSYIEDNAALRLKECKHFRIIRNRVTNSFFGIYLEHAAHGLLLSNEIRGTPKSTEAAAGNGVHAWYCNRLSILNNTITGQRDGIYFEFVKNSIIRRNKSFRNMRYGLHFMFSDDDAYLYNTFLENGAGVAVMFSRRIQMLSNNFERNWGRSSYGLLLKEIYDGKIVDNNFTYNTIAIFVEGSNRLTYRRNNFERNGWAIKMSGGCETNRFTENNFLSNSMDLVVNAEGLDNTYNGNYWSALRGYDLDTDGIADVPYFPVKLYSYILEQSPEAIVLMRSLFVDIINFSEKVSPIFTPKSVVDNQPRMRPVQ